MAEKAESSFDFGKLIDPSSLLGDKLGNNLDLKEMKEAVEQTSGEGALAAARSKIDDNFNKIETSLNEKLAEIENDNDNKNKQSDIAKYQKKLAELQRIRGNLEGEFTKISNKLKPNDATDDHLEKLWVLGAINSAEKELKSEGVIAQSDILSQFGVSDEMLDKALNHPLFGPMIKAIYDMFKGFYPIPSIEEKIWINENFKTIKDGISNIDSKKVLASVNKKEEHDFLVQIKKDHEQNGGSDTFDKYFQEKYLQGKGVKQLQGFLSKMGEGGATEKVYIDARTILFLKDHTFILKDPTGTPTENSTYENINFSLFNAEAELDDSKDEYKKKLEASDKYGKNIKLGDLWVLALDEGKTDTGIQTSLEETDKADAHKAYAKEKIQKYFHLESVDTITQDEINGEIKIDGVQTTIRIEKEETKYNLYLFGEDTDVKKKEISSEEDLKKLIGEILKIDLDVT